MELEFDYTVIYLESEGLHSIESVKEVKLVETKDGFVSFYSEDLRIPKFMVPSGRVVTVSRVEKPKRSCSGKIID